MKTQLIAGLLVALSASAAAPAFASGYGPAPAYRPLAGAPASQSGPSVQTLAAGHADATDSRDAYGGVVSGGSQSGSRAAATPGSNLFTHH